MALAPAELRRGRIVYGIYPFAAQFPLRLSSGAKVAGIEDFAGLTRGAPQPAVTDVRLRPLLLLHDGTRGEHQDLICLRVNTVKDSHRRHVSSWSRIERREHPFFFHLPRNPRYGLPRESVIALTSVGTVHKSAILGPRHVGELRLDEMQVLSERLAATLSLDLAPAIAARALELLRRAGLIEA